MSEFDSKLANSASALRLIDILQSLGFDNDSFSRLHHLRQQNKYETIGSFSAYCRTPRDFRERGNNHCVVCSLNYVLETYIRADRSSFISQDATDLGVFFKEAAEEAYRRIPPDDN